MISVPIMERIEGRVEINFPVSHLGPLFSRSCFVFASLRMLLLKYPDVPPLPMKMPSPEEIQLFHVTPLVISVLD